jgi:uncharacterized protein Yka (UPF0111/DUF47 family)
MLRIMPRQKVYFDCFERCARAGVAAAAALAEMIRNPGSFADYVSRIEDLEREGDRATAAVVETLEKNMATPFDRSAIRALIEALDDVLDGIDTVAHKLVMYRATNPRAEALELAGLLAVQVPAMERAVAALSASRTAEPVLAHCREVHKLETDADKVLRRGIGALFDELKDPIELIKWKEIFEILEHATDKCEDAVRVIEEVIRQHA